MSKSMAEYTWEYPECKEGHHLVSRWACPFSTFKAYTELKRAWMMWLKTYKELNRAADRCMWLKTQGVKESSTCFYVAQDIQELNRAAHGRMWLKAHKELSRAAHGCMWLKTFKELKRAAHECMWLKTFKELKRAAHGYMQRKTQGINKAEDRNSWKSIIANFHCWYSNGWCWWW